MFQTVSGQPQRSIARLLGSTGARDPTFTTDADVPTLVCMSLQPSGQIIVGGPFSFTRDPVAYGALLRLNSNGTVDYAYHAPVYDEPPGGQTGYFPNPTPVTLALQSDGKLIVGGYYGELADISIYNLGRLSSQGGLDGPFDRAHSDIVGQVYCAVVRKDGTSLIGGDFPGNLKHLTNAGAFAPAPIVLNGSVTSIAMQTDGKSIVSGPFTVINSSPRSGIARFADDGTLSGFDTTTARGNVTMQADGRVLATTSAGVARLMNEVATQRLIAAVTARKVRWERTGTSPEAESVTFDLSNDGGATWQPLGHGVRVTNELSTWELVGLNLPATGKLRARARVPCGQYNSSSSLLESVATFDATPANGSAR